MKWMAFTMPVCVKPANRWLLLLLLWPVLTLAGNFGVNINHVALIDNGTGYQMDTEIDYQLSPLAKDALEKGVALTWDIRLEIRQPGFLWTSVIYKKKLRYTLQYHALLKQYEVRTSDAPTEMFLTLNAALNFMSLPKPRGTLAKSLLKSDQRYLLAARCTFNRELLPVPLRPFTYLNQQWFLSSPWFIWPIQK